MLPSVFKKAWKKTPIYKGLTAFREQNLIREWENQGRQIPPPHQVKQRVVREYARQYSLRTLVETGTFQGDMIEACKSQFSNIYSIEIDKALYEAACLRFKATSNVHIINGDSGNELGGLLQSLQSPCLFWLDGHYSGTGTGRGNLDSPIQQELNAVHQYFHPEHVILIDDARCFTGIGGYPTLQHLREIVLQQFSGWVFEVKDDIVRCHKSR